MKIDNLKAGKNYKTDAIIIGAGPVGLFAVFELGLLDINCHLIDILDKPGGQCSELYPEKPIYDIPGIPMVSGQGLTDSLLKQIAPFKPSFHLLQMAQSLSKNKNDDWTLKTNEGTLITAKIVVIAAGGGSFVPKKPTMQNIEKFEKLGFVKYSVKNINEFKNKLIVISGGGDSALDWTNTLAPIAKKVILVHRREEFRASPDSVNKMYLLKEEGKVDLMIGQVKSLIGKSNLQQISIESIGNKHKFNVNADYLLPFFGLTMKLGPIADFGINFEIIVDKDKNKFDVLNQCNSEVASLYTEPLMFGQQIKITDIYKTLNNITGVVDTKNVKIVFKDGTNYSSVGSYTTVSELMSADGRYVACPKNVVYELKFPTQDIKGAVV